MLRLWSWTTQPARPQPACSVQRAAFTTTYTCCTAVLHRRRPAARMLPAADVSRAHGLLLVTRRAQAPGLVTGIQSPQARQRGARSRLRRAAEA